MTPKGPRVFDLILEDGRYCINCSAVVPPSYRQEIKVVDVLAVKGLYRLPWVGVLLRNSWAKRRGAFLTGILQG